MKSNIAAVRTRLQYEYRNFYNMVKVQKNKVVPITLDGLPIRHSINFLPDDMTLNEWSRGKVVQVPVLADGMRPGWVRWRGRRRYEFDVPFFYAMIGDWARGCTTTEARMPGIYRQNPMTKEQALDLSFEICPGEAV